MLTLSQKWNYYTRLLGYRNNGSSILINHKCLLLIILILPLFFSLDLINLMFAYKYFSNHKFKILDASALQLNAL